MQQPVLCGLLILYLIFVSMDLSTAVGMVAAPSTVIIKLIFSCGCLVWIHLDQRDRFETVDFDLVRIFLLIMPITDYVLSIPAKIEGSTGQIFFAVGITSACFGQLALILRHLRLSAFDRTKSIGAISLNVSRQAQIYYLSVFVLVEAGILVIGLVLRGLASFPFVAAYAAISLASFAAAVAYLFSKHPIESRRLAFMGVLLLVISDTFIGLGPSVLKSAAYTNLIVWATYAPVLLLIGASILQLNPINPVKSFAGQPER